jgi:hypothetical protein
VTVAPGQNLAIQYMAPTVTFRRGSLGAGAQKSAGRSFVWILNVVVLVLVLIGAVAYLTSR